jgi:hypothetical protein
MKCRLCDSTEVIYSGVDAFVLECMEDIEKICYRCAYEKLNNKLPVSSGNATGE